MADSISKPDTYDTELTDEDRELLEAVAALDSDSARLAQRILDQEDSP